MTTKTYDESKILLHGGGRMNFMHPSIQDMLRDRSSLLIIPYARSNGDTWEEVTDGVRNILSERGVTIEMKGINEYGDHRRAIYDAEAIFVMGGNSFVLLKSLYDEGVITALRDSVYNGVPFIGASAGANIAGMTIMTTNDMPIVYPPSFRALSLVPFVINPHYPSGEHAVGIGESRDMRIKEYLAFNLGPVVALEETAMLHIVGGKVDLLTGFGGAKIFSRGEEPKEFEAGASLDFLLR